MDILLHLSRVNYLHAFNEFTEHRSSSALFDYEIPFEELDLTDSSTDNTENRFSADPTLYDATNCLSAQTNSCPNNTFFSNALDVS